MRHDQSFKNLILDYPRDALAFFAADEAERLAPDARITPLRQEQLSERLGERFRELDVALQVEWPDGRRAALLFVLEHESRARRFQIHRLVHYCVDLAVLCRTERVVPVVIFLDRGGAPGSWSLGSERHTYLHFHYIACRLAEEPYRRHLDSDNLVARLNLPNMAWRGSEQKLEAYAAALRGLLALEPDPERRLKYVNFVDIYAGLDDNERVLFERHYPQESEQMSGFAERFREEGLQEGQRKGLEQGLERGQRQGEAAVLLRQLERKFGAEQTAACRARIEQADAETLLAWSERILTAARIEDVFDRP